jgi:2-oxoacid:acceptor oxidoreductase gamma subunit (pyruvate/2-ketoisovalerate family)
VLEIVIQGRGGQGAQTAGNLLAAAFFGEGAHVQSFASYGGARRGTPVSSFIRADVAPVRLRCDIERADAILCFDATLLEGRLLAAADERTVIVVNSGRGVADFARTLPGYRVVPIDAIGISLRCGARSPSARRSSRRRTSPRARRASARPTRCSARESRHEPSPPTPLLATAGRGEQEPTGPPRGAHFSPPRGSEAAPAASVRAVQ